MSISVLSIQLPIYRPDSTIGVNRLQVVPSAKKSYSMYIIKEPAHGKEKTPAPSLRRRSGMKIPWALRPGILEFDSVIIKCEYPC